MIRRENLYLILISYNLMPPLSLRQNNGRLKNGKKYVEQTMKSEIRNLNQIINW